MSNGAELAVKREAGDGHGTRVTANAYRPTGTGTGKRAAGCRYLKAQFFLVVTLITPLAASGVPYNRVAAAPLIISTLAMSAARSA